MYSVLDIVGRKFRLPERYIPTIQSQWETLIPPTKLHIRKMIIL